MVWRKKEEKSGRKPGRRLATPARAELMKIE